MHSLDLSYGDNHKRSYKRLYAICSNIYSINNNNLFITNYKVNMLQSWDLWHNSQHCFQSMPWRLKTICVNFQNSFGKMDYFVFYLIKYVFAMLLDIALSLGIVLVRFGKSFKAFVHSDLQSNVLLFLIKHLILKNECSIIVSNVRWSPELPKLLGIMP
jgi:hypothetical protein